MTLTLLSSWNTELAYQRAQFIGEEARKKGVNLLLGPLVGPIGRIVRGGRNWEGKKSYIRGRWTAHITDCNVKQEPQ